MYAPKIMQSKPSVFGVANPSATIAVALVMLKGKLCCDFHKPVTLARIKSYESKVAFVLLNKDLKQPEVP
jgi:hypothetical protein